MVLHTAVINGRWCGVERPVCGVPAATQITNGICFIIDGEIATTVAEAETILRRPKRNIPVDIYFIQTKTSDSYDRGEMLKFGDGVADFVSDDPQLPQGDFIRQQKAIFDLLVTSGMGRGRHFGNCNDANTVVVGTKPLLPYTVDLLSIE